MSDRKEDLSIYKKALEVLTMPVLLVGADEHILFMNKAYGEFLGIEPEKIIGKHIYEVIENSRVPLVLKTQKAEYAHRHKYTQGKVKGKEITRVGSNKTIPIDVRIIAATNRNLEKLVQDGKFREDLYYRVNILNIKAPSLREHPEDIHDLAVDILSELYQENGVKKRVSKDVCSVFQQYGWPGNVRELNNILSKMYYMSDDDEITPEDIPPHIIRGTAMKKSKLKTEGLDQMVDAMEKRMVLQALKQTNYNLTKTARILKISRPRLYRIMKKIPEENLKKG